MRDPNPSDQDLLMECREERNRLEAQLELTSRLMVAYQTLFSDALRRAPETPHRRIYLMDGPLMGRIVDWCVPGDALTLPLPLPQPKRFTTHATLLDATAICTATYVLHNRSSFTARYLACSQNQSK